MVVRQLIALPSQLQLIDRLQHHIYLSSSLIFVSGEQGAGKSTLLEQLSNNLPGNVQEAFVQLHEHLSDPQIRQQIIMQLYEDPLFDAQDSLFSSISLLQEKQNSDVPRLIIFDNAHYLSSELLAELVELIAQKERLDENEINVLLLADEEHNRQMLSFVNQAQQDLYKNCPCLEFKLEALSSDEANSLLDYLFRQAGYQHQIQHQDALSKQLKSCAGIPQKIIKLAEKIIAGELKSNEPSWLKARLPAFLLMFALLTVAAGLANYLYPLFIKPAKPPAEVKEALENKSSLLDRRDIAAPVNNEVMPEKVQPVMVEELAGNWKKAELPDIDDNLLQVGVSDARVKREIISEQNILNLAAPEKADVANIEPGINDIAKEKRVATPELQAVQEPKVQMQQTPELQEVLEVSEVQTVSEREALQQADEIREVSVENGVIEEQVVALQPEVVLPIQSEKQAPGKGEDLIFTAKSQLLSVPPSHFTLQLSAMTAEKSLQQFILQHGLPKANLYVYQTIRNNKPLYVVIFGEYESSQAAEKASKKLPGSLANMKSWIKKYQSVHQDLQVNNE